MKIILEKNVLQKEKKKKKFGFQKAFFQRYFWKIGGRLIFGSIRYFACGICQCDKCILPKQAIFGAWLNKCFVYKEDDILFYEACKML